MLSIPEGHEVGACVDHLILRVLTFLLAHLKESPRLEDGCVLVVFIVVMHSMGNDGDHRACGEECSIGQTKILHHFARHIHCKRPSDATELMSLTDSQAPMPHILWDSLKKLSTLSIFFKATFVQPSSLTSPSTSSRITRAYSGSEAR